MSFHIEENPVQRELNLVPFESDPYSVFNAQNFQMG